MQIKIKSKKNEKKSQKKSVRHTPNGFFVSLIEAPTVAESRL